MDIGAAVTMELSRAEAIVLFEFLSRTNAASRIQVEDQAEQRVLWNIEAVLQKALDEPFRADYLKILQRARDEVRDKE